MPVYKIVVAKILDPVVGKFIDTVIAEQVSRIFFRPTCKCWKTSLMTSGIVQRISPNEAAQLHHLLSLLLEVISSLGLIEAGHNLLKYVLQCETAFESPAQAEAQVASLARLRKLTELLVYTTVQIIRIVYGNLTRFFISRLILLRELTTKFVRRASGSFLAMSLRTSSSEICSCC